MPLLLVAKTPRPPACLWLLLLMAACPLLMNSSFASPTTGNPASPLDPLRWKQRVILYSLPSATRNEDLSRLGKLIDENADAIRERDILFVTASMENREPPAFHHLLSKSAFTELAKQFSFREDVAEFLLIGKDGFPKSRQAGALDLESFFVLIDAMPMRQREIDSSKNQSSQTGQNVISTP